MKAHPSKTSPRRVYRVRSPTTAHPVPVHRYLLAVGLALLLVLGGIVIAALVHGPLSHYTDELHDALRAPGTEAAPVLRAELERAAERLSSRDGSESVVVAIAFLGSVIGCAMLVLTVRRLVARTQRHVARDREAQAALAKLNGELEDRVRERTRELLAAHGALEEELERRAVMEIELRQAQKLEAMGRLSAGVAHEINTPIQFVNDSLQFMRETIADIGRLVPQWQAVAEAASRGEARADDAREVIDEAEVVEIDYLLEHLPKAMDRMSEGLKRVATIVRSLKDFAHPDNQAMIQVDLNHAVETTLEIARNEYKYVADVETDFGRLPGVLCHAGEINQVILNIVVNAAHAIADKVGDGGERGRILVRTRNEGDHVSILFSDTGMGIPERVRDRIFEPFFTTKEPGRGTGQGLAISHRVVVEKHGGSISFDSEVGKGTTFYVRLPVDGPKARERSPTATGILPRPALSEAHP